MGAFVGEGVFISAKGSGELRRGERGQGAKLLGRKGGEDTREYGFRHGVVASTWAFEAQGPGSIPGGGAQGPQVKLPE